MSCSVPAMLAARCLHAIQRTLFRHGKVAAMSIISWCWHRGYYSPSAVVGLDSGEWMGSHVSLIGATRCVEESTLTARKHRAQSTIQGT